MPRSHREPPSLFDVSKKKKKKNKRPDNSKNYALSNNSV